ncbi:cupredoxin domain-containing protein [Corynebacterium pelargi]|uniref:Uncharacterized protein n=1 Tax=Corynebacterium pelargi TaxID=1471400 RepID=A0A410W9G1_9CORY|nr:cupredoxin domain-containing protein [Corynebacterium pelargi]QAU52592.1 hypothetical protein CPELA_06645 [Corynebacterium pelargi]GGG77515.1 hypothetical protein GCM10007338_14220 [Corynebacterium pelargi]
MDKQTQNFTFALLGLGIAAVISILAQHLAPQLVLADQQATHTQQAEAGRAVQVRIEGLSFVPDVIEASPGQTLDIEVHNTGDMTHDLVLGSQRTALLAPGQRDHIRITVHQGMRGWCSLPGHRQQGMVLDIRLR